MMIQNIQDVNMMHSELNKPLKLILFLSSNKTTKLNKPQRKIKNQKIKTSCNNKKIHKICILSYGTSFYLRDLLFESTCGDKGYCDIFESMIPGSMIHVTILNLWAIILNHQEQHKNKKSPSRMFVSSSLLVIPKFKVDCSFS